MTSIPSLWYRNAGPGDNLGTKVNLNKRRPVYHLPGHDWFRTGRALCGARLARPGFCNYAPDPRESCKRCAGKGLP